MWSCRARNALGFFFFDISFFFYIQIFRQGPIPPRHRTGFWPLAAQVWCLWLAGSGSGLRTRAGLR